MDRDSRTRLRDALRLRYAWVEDPAWGPSAVEAGECDGCRAEARLVMTCGPGGLYLGRRCTEQLGVEAWCDGHADEAAAVAAWTLTLPPEVDVVARLWWVATGEVVLDPHLLAAYTRELPGTRP